ncbi:MAG: hypothetical protein EAZ55_03735 [Cytophagales bacterium]|nr:MAG: hypothetical protein EAZ55_03735 [Cytophagales bacterium]
MENNSYQNKKKFFDFINQKTDNLNIVDNTIIDVASEMRKIDEFLGLEKDNQKLDYEINSNHIKPNENNWEALKQNQENLQKEIHKNNETNEKIYTKITEFSQIINSLENKLNQNQSPQDLSTYIEQYNPHEKIQQLYEKINHIDQNITAIQQPNHTNNHWEEIKELIQQNANNTNQEAIAQDVQYLKGKVNELHHVFSDFQINTEKIMSEISANSYYITKLLNKIEMLIEHIHGTAKQNNSTNE